MTDAGPAASIDSMTIGVFNLPARPVTKRRPLTSDEE
jgi:hypothetical protein